MIICLLPGSIISVSLFINAFLYDVKTQNVRAAVESTNLSQIQIEGYVLGEFITDWDPKENLCTAICESGEKYYRRTDDTMTWANMEGVVVGIERLSPLVFTGNSPIAIIKMEYPVVNRSWSDDKGLETWMGFTINGTSVSDFISALESLGDNHITVEDSRTTVAYTAYFDKENNIELRFNYSDGQVNSLTLMRIDRRSSMEFFVNRNLLFDDNLTDEYYGNQMFDHLELFNICSNISEKFEGKQFLYTPYEYFCIPLYVATWIFPLILAIYRHQGKWMIWYPFWSMFCWLTLIAHY